MWLLYRHDSGIDGWDAHSEPVAVFDRRDRLMVMLVQAGYESGDGGVFHHKDPAKRYTMNAITYSFREVPFNEWDFEGKVGAK